MKNKKNIDLLNKLLEKKEKIFYKTIALENNLFKIESYYNEMVNGFPIIKNIEFYLKNKVEKKKINIDEKERVFSMENPVVKTIEFID